jgi:putative secretion ATPase (PEP-CTERM system associated)
MYEAFYGFREKPFSLTPDPDFLYLSKKHDIALGLLEYSLMDQTVFSVITGDIGTGKTTLIRYLLNRMEQDITVGLISNTQASFGELLEWILFALGLEYRGKQKGELYQTLVDFVIQQYAQNRRTVLIIDEAQNMAPETLEELRMLSNINVDKHQVLQVILVGQAGLRDTLRRPELEQFAQRIGVDYHLEALSREETHAYIQHRLKVAGAKSLALFSAQACDAVFQFSGGIPRLINLLCDTALVYGFAEQRDRIEAELIQDVARDKQQGQVFPLRTGDITDSEPSPTDLPPVVQGLPGGSYVSDAIRKHREQEQARKSASAAPARAEATDERPSAVPSVGEPRWDRAATDFGAFMLDSELVRRPRRRQASSWSADRGQRRRSVSSSQVAIAASVMLNIGIIALLGLAWGSSRFEWPISMAFLQSVKAFIENLGQGEADRDGGTDASVMSTRRTELHGGGAGGSPPQSSQSGPWQPYAEPPALARAPAHPAVLQPQARPDDGSGPETEPADEREPAESSVSVSIPAVPDDEPDRPRVVVVKAGESLSSIVTDNYGKFDEDTLKALLHSNPEIHRPDVIMVGQVIRLPDP